MSPKSSHIIQISAKVLGSDREQYFSEYILPPVQVPSKIEKLTGITNVFLQSGGLDKVTGYYHNGPANDFQEVYRRFIKFCRHASCCSSHDGNEKELEQGVPGINENQTSGLNPSKSKCKSKNQKDIILLAHNAPFDLRMLNSEIKRLASAVRKSGTSGMKVPLLSRDTGITGSIDTLSLLKSKKLWAGQEKSYKYPDSFSLSSLYTHLFGKEIEQSHNALTDVLALEEILLSSELKDWKEVAKPLYVCFELPTKVEHLDINKQ